MSQDPSSKLPPTSEVSKTDWVSETGKRWAAAADQLEAQLVPVGDLLDAAAAIRPGEIVLDVGCGRGASTRQAAARAGHSGAVTGIDVAANLIDEATAVAHDGAPIDWIVGDAQTYPLEPERHDVVISRFGTMFFADAVEAFTNIRRASVDGGRLCSAVWQRRDCSELMQRPIDVALSAAAGLGFALDLPAADSGPFSFGDPDFVRQMLDTAGWTAVTFTPHELEMYAGGRGSVEQTVETSMGVGALRAALADAPDEVVDAVRAAIIADLAPLHDGVGVKMGGAVAIIEASRG
jgi:SAM-dependent methyltransferase